LKEDAAVTVVQLEESRFKITFFDSTSLTVKFIPDDSALMELIKLSIWKTIEPLAVAGRKAGRPWEQIAHDSSGSSGADN
jgi:hypothetical protein